MLTYKFSRREKGLLLGFALILVLLAWYQFVYAGTTNRLTELQGEISTVQTETTLATSKVSEMNRMQQVIDERKAAGAVPRTVPDYDNIRPLMVELNTVLSVANSYELSFSELAMGTNYVERGVDIVYGCNSYDAAEAIIKSLANGTYPCSIGAVTINDSSARSGNNSSTRGLVSGSSVSVSLAVTFYEKLPAGVAAPVSSTSSSSTSSSSSTNSSKGSTTTGASK